LQRHLSNDVPFDETTSFRRVVRHYSSPSLSDCYTFGDGAGKLSFRAMCTQNVNILFTNN